MGELAMYIQFSFQSAVCWFERTYTRKNAQPVASCQQAWTMLCCTLWTTLSTRLFSHDYNVVTALFNHQYCYNLLTRLSNNDNNNEQACSINIFLLFQQPWTTVVALSMLNHIVETRVNTIVGWTTLFSHDNRVVTALFNQQCCNDLCYFQLCSRREHSDQNRDSDSGI